VKLTFSGAARTVTGSQHILDVNGQRILLDCGLHQGKRKEAWELNRKGPCKGSEVDVLVLSHAHIDHSGSIPCLSIRAARGSISWLVNSFIDCCKRICSAVKSNSISASTEF